MIKVKSKISKISTYLILLGYLTLTSANIFHYHNVELGNLFSSFNSVNKDENNHINLLGSEVFCAVQFAFNLLHTSIVTSAISYQEFQISQDIFHSGIVSSKPIIETIFNFCLRAPPNSFS